MFWFSALCIFFRGILKLGTYFRNFSEISIKFRKQRYPTQIELVEVLQSLTLVLNWSLWTKKKWRYNSADLKLLYFHSNNSNKKIKILFHFQLAVILFNWSVNIFSKILSRKVTNSTLNCQSHSFQYNWDLLSCNNKCSVSFFIYLLQLQALLWGVTLAYGGEVHPKKRTLWYFMKVNWSQHWTPTKKSTKVQLLWLFDPPWFLFSSTKRTWKIHFFWWRQVATWVPVR